MSHDNKKLLVRQTIAMHKMIEPTVEGLTQCLESLGLPINECDNFAFEWYEAESKEERLEIIDEIAGLI